MRRAICEIEKLGGYVTIDETSTGKSVVGVALEMTHVTDAELEHLEKFAQLRVLDLSFTGVTCLENAFANRETAPISLTDPVDNTTLWVYDALRSVTQETNELGAGITAPRSGVSLMLGRRGGNVVSDAALDQLERGLLGNRITLTRNADNLLSSKNSGGLLRVYKDGSASLFLRKYPTRYEILHESQHIEHLRQIGAKRYVELSKTKAGNLELEQFVYDNLRRHHWSSLTPDEIKHAQWYIRDVLGGNAW